MKPDLHVYDEPTPGKDYGFLKQKRQHKKTGNKKKLAAILERLKKRRMR